MSARQRARLAHQVIPVKSVAQSGETDESSSEGEDISRKVVTTKTFQFETSSGSSEEASDDCADKHSNTQSDLGGKTARIPMLTSKIPHDAKSNSYDELAFLDAVIVENSASQSTVVQNELSVLFEFVNGKALD